MLLEDDEPEEWLLLDDELPESADLMLELLEPVEELLLGSLMAELLELPLFALPDWLQDITATRQIATVARITNSFSIS